MKRLIKNNDILNKSIMYKENNSMLKRSINIKNTTLVIVSFLLLIALCSNSVFAASLTGPFRRVSSKVGTSSNPYSYIQTKVTLPQGDKVVEVETSDIAYIYVGGSANGTEIDAGLQHSRLNNNWAPVISCKGVIFNPNPLVRFQGGQTVTMVFYVSSDNNVKLKVTGRVTTGETKTVIVDCNNAIGWKANGVGNLFKRVTSIAQKPENLYTKSFIKGVMWYDSYIGTVNNYHQWLASDTSGYISYPDNGKVAVNYINAGQETVTIDLSK